MKRIILTLLAVTFSIFAYSQPKIGLRAGMNISNALVKSEIVEINSKALVGYQIGLTLDQKISNNLYFSTALLYSKKGYQIKSFDVKHKINYLDIPLNIQYKEEVGSVKVYGEAGPYLGIGLATKLKGDAISVDTEFGSGSGELKRMDVGLNFGAGVEIDKFKIGINYGLGLMNLENVDDSKIKNRNFAIFAAYIFN